MTKAEQETQLARTASLLSLEGLLDRKPSQLSGGQQQRVALGRAIISEKPVCLMDEPLSNLDAKLRHEMRVEIRALQQKLGITMVYVTHDQVEAISMADQIVLLNKGQIEQVGSPSDIYQTPETAFVARFIGTPPMNVIAATYADGVLRISGSADMAASADFLEPAAYQIGLRPEEITIADRGVSAEVISSEYLGADTLVDCRVGTEILTVRDSQHRHFKQGERLCLTWQDAALHLFDQSSGSRVNGQLTSRSMENEAFA